MQKKLTLALLSCFSVNIICDADQKELSPVMPKETSVLRSIMDAVKSDWEKNEECFESDWNKTVDCHKRSLSHCCSMKNQERDVQMKLQLLERVEQKMQAMAKADSPEMKKASRKVMLAKNEWVRAAQLINAVRVLMENHAKKMEESNSKICGTMQKADGKCNRALEMVEPLLKETESKMEESKPATQIMENPSVESVPAA